MDDPVCMAIKTIHKALEQRPQDGPLRYALAALLAIHGDLKNARKQMLEAMKLGVDADALQRWISQRLEKGDDKPPPD